MGVALMLSMTIESGFHFKKNTKLARLLAIIAQYGFPIRMSFLVTSIVAVSMNKIPLWIVSVYMIGRSS